MRSVNSRLATARTRHAPCDTAVAVPWTTVDQGHLAEEPAPFDGVDVTPRSEDVDHAVEHDEEVPLVPTLVRDAGGSRLIDHFGVLHGALQARAIEALEDRHL